MYLLEVALALLLACRQGHTHTHTHAHTHTHTHRKRRAFACSTFSKVGKERGSWLPKGAPVPTAASCRHTAPPDTGLLTS